MTSSDGASRESAAATYPTSATASSASASSTNDVQQQDALSVVDSNAIDTTAHASSGLSPPPPSTVTDRMRWPINRLSYEELKPHELAAVEKLFAARDDAPMLMKWVLLHRAGKFHKRLAVISPLRLWLLQRKKPFKTQLVVAREFQLIRIQRVNVLSSNNSAASDTSAMTDTAAAGGTTTSIELFVFASARAQQPTKLHFDPGVHSESFVRLLQRLLHALRLVFPDKQLPVVTLPPQCHWREFLSPTTATANANAYELEDRAALLDAMATAYRAFCDDVCVPVRTSVTTRLAECAGARVDFQYCLAFPPGVDGYAQQPFSLLRRVTDLVYAAAAAAAAGGSTTTAVSASAAAIQAREVQALARTLEHCHCFVGVHVYDLALTDVGTSALFQALLSPFSRLQSLALTNVRLSVHALRILQHVVLQSTLKRTTQQPQQQLRDVDFSYNNITVAMAHELATIVELLPSGLATLQLEHCGLTPATSCRVLRAIKTNAAFAASLRELNVAGNGLGDAGTRVLAQWLTTAFALQQLDVSQTDLELNVFAHALRQNSLLHESSLRILDVSYNRMRTAASDDLGWILGRTQSLATMFLRGMQRAFQASAPLRNTRFHLLRTIGISGTGTGLKKTHLTNLLAPLLCNTGRALPCLVDLSENDLSGAKASLLAQLLDASPIAGRASLRLDHTQLHDKFSILLLHALRNCRALRSLSLEGNGFVKRRTATSLQRFHAQSSAPTSAPNTDALLEPPNALEVAAANVFALMLSGSAPSSSSTPSSLLLSPSSSHDARNVQTRALADASASATSTQALPLQELCLKSDINAPMLFGAHVICAVVDALALSQTLQVLDVSGNECGDALAMRLGVVLRVNHSLQVLFWDDNFTTVDGFQHFYDGLTLNKTLVMVQMPIRDTRRILEQQKDPPREKLFSVLAKMFKVTERNQTLARTKTQQRTHRRRQRKTATASAVTVRQSTADITPLDAKTDAVRDATHASQDPTSDEIEHESTSFQQHKQQDSGGNNDEHVHKHGSPAHDGARDTKHLILSDNASSNSTDQHTKASPALHDAQLSDDNVDGHDNGSSCCNSKSFAIDTIVTAVATDPQANDSDVGSDNDDDADDDCDAPTSSLWSDAVAESVRSRYPSTMHSWSRASGDDDILQTSWSPHPVPSPSLSQSLHT